MKVDPSLTVIRKIVFYSLALLRVFANDSKDDAIAGTGRSPRTAEHLSFEQRVHGCGVDRRLSTC